MFLLSYLPVFPAFLRLRKIDPDTPRPFRVPGGGGWLAVLAWVPMVLIVISILFTGVPLTAEEVSEKAPILIGSLIFLALGEILIALRGGKKHAN